MPSIFKRFADAQQSFSSNNLNSDYSEQQQRQRERMMFDNGIGQQLDNYNNDYNGFGPVMSPGVLSSNGTGTIWDEMESVQTQQPNSVPQDPGPTPTTTTSSSSLVAQSPAERFQIIQDELMFTLASRVNGYTNLDDLARDFATDTGYIPERVAMEYGFTNFRHMVISDEMKRAVMVKQVEGESTFLPRDTSRFRHIRDEQVHSEQTTVQKEESEEMEKLARALLPQNKEQYIKGKKVILRILNNLVQEGHTAGPEGTVLWARIQQRYKEETGKELAGEELKSMFQRDKAIKILTQYFANEVQVIEAKGGVGHFYLKLRKSYEEILQNFDEVLRQQREAVQKSRNKRRNPGYNNTNPNNAPQRKATLEERFPPDLYMVQGTSQSIVQPPSPPHVVNNNNNVGEEIDDDDEIGLGMTTGATNNSKFALPPVNNVMKKPKLDSTPPAEPNGRAPPQFSWNPSDLPTFEGEREDGNGNSNSNKTSNNGTPKAPSTTTNNNNNKNGKKTQYTAKTADGNYTDSDEEVDDGASDVTLMDDDNTGAAGAGGQNVAAQQQQQSNSMNMHQQPKMQNVRPLPVFDPKVAERPAAVGQQQPLIANKPVGHQVTIQKHMKELMASRGGAGASGSTSHQKNQTNSLMRNGPPARDPSLSDDEDDWMPPAQHQQNGIVQQQPKTAAVSSRNSAQQPMAASATNRSATIPAAAVPRSDFGVISASSNHQANASSAPLPTAGLVNRDGFALMEHVEELREMAGRLQLNYDTRHDEGSFAFRRNDRLLIFTEFDESKVRGSWHQSGHIYRERYFPKVDWAMFCATIRGLLVETYAITMADSPLSSGHSEGAVTAFSSGSEVADGRPATRPAKPWGCPPWLSHLELQESNDIGHQQVERSSNNNNVQWGCPPDLVEQNRNRSEQHLPIRHYPSAPDMQQFRPAEVPMSKRRSATNAQGPWILPKVPMKFRLTSPPFPAYKTTVNGRDFLAFFTKIYGFSNHHAARFRLDGDHFCCSEQYYMYEKARWFGYQETAEEIMTTCDAGTIKRLGTADTLRARHREGREPNARVFDHDEWREVKEKVMFKALYAKFEQNLSLQHMLVDTGDAMLVEASPSDQYWGIGCGIDSSEIEDTSKWRGDNRMGFLLMQIRQKFQHI